MEKANVEMQKQLAAQTEINAHIEARFTALEKTRDRIVDKPATTLAVNPEDNGK